MGRENRIPWWRRWHTIIITIILHDCHPYYFTTLVLNKRMKQILLHGRWHGSVYFQEVRCMKRCHMAHSPQVMHTKGKLQIQKKKEKSETEEDGITKRIKRAPIWRSFWKSYEYKNIFFSWCMYVCVMSLFIVLSSLVFLGIFSVECGGIF